VFATQENTKTVLIVAGEASGDLHGSNLVKAMRRLNPQLVFLGIGGEKMEQAGVKILVSASEMAVVGFTEVFAKIKTILKANIKLKNILIKAQADLLILIDYPDFNLHLAAIAKRFSVPVFYYISPQVWAWRKGRVKKIARRVDRMAVILPFEEAFYKKRGVDVDYVGHPLLDVCPETIDKNSVRTRFGALKDQPVLGLLPGSRKEEINNLLPVMIDSLKIIKNDFPAMQCFLPLAHTLSYAFIQPFINRSQVKIKVVRGEDIHEILGICDVALVTSGTATLETAFMETPMVVIYRGSRLSAWIARRFIRVPYVSLVNLVAGENLVRELLQDDVRPDLLANEALRLLKDDKAIKNVRDGLRKVKGSVGRRGASERAAEIALEILDEKRL
jgi:lipid-A-disaccharide synthase